MEFRAAQTVDFPARACALQQTEAYRRVITEMGAQAQAFVALKSGRPVARFQVVTRRFGPLNLAWLPRGPVWVKDLPLNLRAQVITDLPRTLKAKATWIVAPDHPDDIGHVRHTPLVSPQSVAELDLTASPEGRLAAQHGKWRNRLKHAQNAGLRVTHRRFLTARDEEVLQLEIAQRNFRHYKALPPEFARVWAKQNPQDSRLFTISHRGTALAYLLVLLHWPVATYHIGWTGLEGRLYSAHNLGLWEASNWLARKGYTRFDLGNVDTQHAPGLARFKIGSGAAIRALGPTSLCLPRLSFSRLLRRDAA